MFVCVKITQLGGYRPDGGGDGVQRVLRWWKECGSGRDGVDRVRVFGGTKDGHGNDGRWQTVVAKSDGTVVGIDSVSYAVLAPTASTVIRRVFRTFPPGAGRATEREAAARERETR